MSGQIVMATTNASIAAGGVPVSIRKGEAWDSESPIVKAHPDLFTTDPAKARGAAHQVNRPVEQATRAPGEKSRTRRG